MKKYQIFIITFFCFVTGTNSLVASNIDSLKNELHIAKQDTNKVNILWELGNYLLESDPAQTIKFAEQAKDLSRKLSYNTGLVLALNMIGKANLTLGNYKVGRENSASALVIALKIRYIPGEAVAYSTIGTSYLYQSQLDSALSNYTKAITELNKINNKIEIAGINNNIGIIYQQKGDLKKAIEIYLGSLKLYQDLGKKGGAARTMYCIAGIYTDQKNYDQALLYYTNAMTIFKEINNNRGLGASFTGIGSVYFEQKNFSKAKEYLLQALKVNTEMQDKTGMVATLVGIGSVYDMEGDYNNSLKYHLQSLEISKQIQNHHAVALSYLNIGTLYIRSGNSAKAIEYLKNSLSLADSINDKKIIYLAYQNFSEAYEKQNNFKEALKYHQLFTGLKDSIFNEENSTQINELSAKYESEKKEKEILLLNTDVQSKQKDKEILSTKIENRNYVIYGTVSGAFLLLASIVLLFSRRQLKQKSKHQTELFKQKENTAISILQGQEKERTRIAKDLHDSIGTSLSTLKVNLQLFEDSITKEKASKYQVAIGSIDQIAIELRNIMNNLSDETLQESGLVSAFEEMVDRINRLGKTHFDFQSHGISKRPENIIELSLFRVGQELLSNCVKYSQASNATLQLIERENGILLMLEDNGIGFDINAPKQKNKEHGMGLKNVHDRVSFIKGTIAIESNAITGTTIIIETPKYLN